MFWLKLILETGISNFVSDLTVDLLKLSDDSK